MDIPGTEPTGENMISNSIGIHTIANRKCPNGHNLCLSVRCWLSMDPKEENDNNGVIYITDDLDGDIEETDDED